MTVKKVVEAVKKAVTKRVVAKKTEDTKCTNCTGNGEQCSVCTVPFEDTFK